MRATDCTARSPLNLLALAALFALERRLVKPTAIKTAISGWLGEIQHRLEQRTSKAPIKPTDLRRQSRLSCNCPDCRTLSEFLDDPRLLRARFPLAKARRQHLHQIIEENHCDTTHVTERTGRPFTLVCTKTTASYDTACCVYERDLRNLSSVVALEQKIP